MLTVAPLASGQAGYYLSLAANAAGYYAKAAEESLEPAGTWYGEGAREFDLQGEVRAEHLARLCEGYDPHTGERLVRNAGVVEGPRARRHGFDLCFSAPKSVSIFWALASDELREAVEEAMHRAVRDALDYIVEHAGVARVGTDGKRLAQVPLTFAIFEHSTSRLGDPNLHCHAVCPNITVNPETGRRIAVYGVPFFEHQLAGGALFRASLAARLVRLGLQIERDGYAFRIRGMSPELCRTMSKRRSEIVSGILEKAQALDHLKDLDVADVLRAARGEMAQLVNLQTRRGKQEYVRSELFPRWREEARACGIEQPPPEALLRAPRTLSPGEKRAAMDEAYREGLAVVESELSHWNERELVQRVAEAAQGKRLDARDVREVVQGKVAGGELIPVGDIVVEHADGSRQCYLDRVEARYTSRQNLALEQELLGRVERMRGKSAEVPEGVVEQVIELTTHKLARRGKGLSAEQAEAVRHLTTEPGLTRCLVGKAGTGKSTCLGAVRLALELAGYRVRGAAVAGVAADALRESAHIESDTLAMTLRRLQTGRLKLGPKDVLVLDEAGMVPTKLMAELYRHLEKAGAKVLLVGDPAQLQSVGAAGGPFHSISRRIGSRELTEVHRQRERWRKVTVEQFSRGEAREALIAYASRKQLHVTDGRDEALLKLVELWKADGGHLAEHAKDVLLLASMNHEVRTLNRLCQLERYKAQELGPGSVRVADGPVFERDRVVFRRKDRTLGLENGFSGEVVSVDEGAGTITVRLDNKGGREVTVSPQEYGMDKLRLAYCQTVHSSQGSTRERVSVLLGGHMMSKHLAYVAASRCRESCHLVADRSTTARSPTLRDAIRTLAAALSRDRTKDLALDVADATRDRHAGRASPLGPSAGLPPLPSLPRPSPAAAPPAGGPPRPLAARLPTVRLAP